MNSHINSREAYWKDFAMLPLEGNLFDKVSNIWGTISETEHCYVFMKEDFRLFPSIFLKYLSSPLYLVIVNADKLYETHTLSFTHVFFFFFPNQREIPAKYNGKLHSFQTTAASFLFSSHLRHCCAKTSVDLGVLIKDFPKAFLNL